METADILKLLQKIFICAMLATFGLSLMILFFMAPAAIPTVTVNATTFFNLALASILLIASCQDTSFFPAQYRTTVRTVATLFFVANVDSAICMTHTLVLGGMIDFFVKADALHAMQFGAVMTIICAACSFLFSYYRRLPVHPREYLAQGPIVIVQKIITFCVCGLLGLAQIIIWATPDMCSNLTGQQFPGASVAVLAHVLFVGTFFDDREAFDLAFVFITRVLVTSPPIFGDIQVSMYEPDATDKWKAEVALQYISALLMLLVVLVGSIARRFSTTSPNGIRERLLSWNTLAQIGCLVVGAVGSICIYAKSPGTLQGHQMNYLASFAWIVPVCEICRQLLEMDLFRGYSLILTFLSFATLGTAASANASLSLGGGAYNAGLVMTTVAIIASPTIGVFLDKPLELRPINEYFDQFGTKREGDAPVDECAKRIFVISLVSIYLSATLFASQTGYIPWPVMLFFGLFLFLGRECASNHDTHRVLFLNITIFLFLGGTWPLNGAASVTSFLEFFMIGYFVFYMAAEHQGRPFAMFGEDTSYEAAAGSSPLLDNHAEGGQYQKVPSGGLGERSSLTANAQGGYQGVSMEEENPSSASQEKFVA